MRISQYFVMPHYQGKGHGCEFSHYINGHYLTYLRSVAKLYSTVYSKLLTDKNVAQITVEDPNESFDDLRDRCDLTTLLKDKVLEGVRASTLDKETMRAIGKKYKLSQVY